MTLSLLVIAIIGLSIGFAVFSSTLNIQSKASVNPTNMSSFQVDDGECPISLNDFPDIYSQEYVERVIASFSK